MKRISRTKLGAFFLCAASALSASAQQTYNEMEQLTVNENVTTVITASEPIRLVDISTDKVVGDKPIENVIRVKPKEGGFSVCTDIYYQTGGSRFRQGGTDG